MKMRLLKDVERGALFSYVGREPAYNQFIIGDVENFGLEGEIVNVAIEEKDGVWDSIVLRYDRHFVVYAKDENYDASTVAQFIKAYDHDVISGKGSIVSKLVPFFLDKRPRLTNLSRCDASALPSKECPRGIVIRHLEPKEAENVISLYCLIEEFRDQYIGREKEKAETLARNLNRGGIGVGAFLDGRLISYAQTTARSSQSAMVVGVCTLPQHRKQGLASEVVRTLCRQSFDSGLHFVCLFYDNVQAGRIYQRIGFRHVGEYLMLVPKRMVQA